jgi:membrane protein YdbS with pleckstrin-like domain
MKLWVQLLFLTILDFIIIWLYVRQEDPDASVSIGILLVVPLAIIINLIIAAILFVVKRRYAKTFLINSLISAAIMYYLFVAGINRHQRLRYEGWNFKIKDTTFNILHSKLDSTFSITYSLSPGSSWSFMDGRFITKNNSYLLTTDSTTFFIRNNFLSGFRGRDSIGLTKVDY